MRLQQFVGPFKKDQVIEAIRQPGERFVRIGLQAPYRTSILAGEAIQDISIGGKSFRIGDTDTLEFSDLDEGSLEFKILRDLPWGSTIDLAYD